MRIGAVLELSEMQDMLAEPVLEWTRAGVTAPAEGLYLLAVRYPERFGLPAAIAAVPEFGS